MSYDIQFWNINSYRKNLSRLFIENPELEDCEKKDELIELYYISKELEYDIDKTEVIYYYDYPPIKR